MDSGDRLCYRLSQVAVVGGQVHRAVRRGLHPAEAGLQPRAHHHPQVAAAGRARPPRRAALRRAAAPGGHRAAQVLGSAPHAPLPTESTQTARRRRIPPF